MSRFVLVLTWQHPDILCSRSTSAQYKYLARYTITENISQLAGSDKLQLEEDEESSQQYPSLGNCTCRSRRLHHIMSRASTGSYRNCKHNHTRRVKNDYQHSREGHVLWATYTELQRRTHTDNPRFPVPALDPYSTFSSPQRCLLLCTDTLYCHVCK